MWTLQKKLSFLFYSILYEEVHEENVEGMKKISTNKG